MPNSYVFLTVVTYQRRPILVDNIELLRTAFKQTMRNYDFDIYSSVILPDHMHLILKPANIEEYPKIIFSIKYYFSRHINIRVDELSSSKLKKGEKGVWHRRYFEHTIRDEKDLNNHIDYIHYNPVKHGLTKNVRDWKFSSFHKFVKNGQYDINWGDFSEEIKNSSCLYED